jgi:hypothetical protein
MTHLALIAEHHPAFAGNFGTPNLIKTICADSAHPFSAIISTDRAGPHPVAGPWDAIPTLGLIRPRSLLPKVGLGLLDNLAFRLQYRWVTQFLKQHQPNALFLLVANNPRLAIFAANLPVALPRYVYLIDDFVQDSAIYRVSKNTAQRTLDKLVLESERIFTISPVYTTELEQHYGRPCEFLPLPISNATLSLAQADPLPPPPSPPLVIHHSGQVHHLYAEALANFINLLQTIANQEQTPIRLEFWGNLNRASLEHALKLDLSQPLGHLEIKVCGFSPHQLIVEQRRANFLLLANSFQPELAPQVRCSFSSKVGEYLVAGRPILLYAPAYASLTAHLGQHQAAFIVSQPSRAEALAHLKQILFEANPAEVVQAAKRLAQTQHSLDTFFNKILTPPDTPWSSQHKSLTFNKV